MISPHDQLICSDPLAQINCYLRRSGYVYFHRIGTDQQSDYFVSQSPHLSTIVRSLAPHDDVMLRVLGPASLTACNLGHYEMIAVFLRHGRALAGFVPQQLTEAHADEIFTQFPLLATLVGNTGIFANRNVVKRAGLDPSRN